MLSIRRFIIICAIIAITVNPGFSQGIAPSDDKKISSESSMKKDSEEKREEGSRKKTGVFTMGEIVVREKSIANIEDAATTTVIKQSDIRARSDKTLDDTLRMVPGLSVETHQKGHVRAKIRGFDQDKIAILIDGIPVSDVYSTDVDISNIPVINISRIIVNRGVSSALYGTNGAIGSINVITKKPPRLFAEATAEYGEWNTYTINVAQGAPIGNFYYWLTGTVMNSDGYEPSEKLDEKTRREWFDKIIRYDLYGYDYDGITIPAKDNYIEDTGRWDHFEYRKYQTAGKFGYEFNPHLEIGLSASFNYRSGKTNTYQPSCYSDYKLQNLWWKDPIFEITTPSDIKKAALRNRAFVWPEIYEYTVSPYLRMEFNKFELRANTFISLRRSLQEGYASTDHSIAKDQAAVLYGDDFDPYQDIKTYLSTGINIFPSYRLSDWNRLSTALLLRLDQHKVEERALSEAESPNIAATEGTDAYPVLFIEALFISLAIEDEMVFFKRLKISAGVSYDAQDLRKLKNRTQPDEYGDAYIVEDNAIMWGTRDSLNPVVGIVYDAAKDFLLLRAAGSIKTRFPTLSEYEKILDSENDHQLKSERSYNGNIGFELSFMDRMLSYRLDYFYSMARDRIEKIAGGTEPPVNIDKVISQGVENTISYRARRIFGIADLDCMLNYTYLHARNRDDSPEEKVNMGEMLEFTPEHQMLAEIRLSFITKTSLNIWGQYTINQIIYVMESRPIPDDTSIGYSTEYFTTVKLHNPLMLNVKLSQKFLERYTIYILCRNIFDDYNADPFNPGPGRMFFIGANAQL